MMLAPLMQIKETDMGTKRKARRAINQIQTGKPVVLEKEFAEYIQMVLDDAKRFCPVDTGALQASIRVQRIGERVPTGYFAKQRPLVLDYQIVAGGPPFWNWKHKKFVDYAMAVHDGTIRMPPRPFIDHAVNFNAPMFERVWRNYVGWIEREWRDK